MSVDDCSVVLFLFPVPDFVRNLEARTSKNSSNVTTISWEPPFLPFQRGVIKYYVVVIDGREGEFIPDEFSNGDRTPENDGFVVNATNITVSSLESSSWYSVRVAAATMVGVGPFSKPFSFKTAESQVPSRPWFVRIFPAGPKAVAVQWGYPRHPRGPIQRFIVGLYDAPFNIPDFPSPSLVKEFVAAATERYHVFLGVLDNDLHVAVQAENRRGIGDIERSNNLVLTHPSSEPRCSLIVTCVSSILVSVGGPIILATNVSESSAAISWFIPSEPLFMPTPPPGPPIIMPFFNILLFPNDDCRMGDPRNGTRLQPMASTFDARHLQPFTVYTVCLWHSFNSIGSSSLGSFITNQSTPGPMSDVHDGSLLMSRVAKTDSVLVKWTAAPTPNGVIGYDIMVIETDTEFPPQWNFHLSPDLLPPPSDSYYRWRVFGLEGGVEYIFLVRPYNLLDNSTGPGKLMYSSTDEGSKFV